MENNVTVCVRSKPMLDHSQIKTFTTIDSSSVLNTLTKDSFQFDKAFADDVQTRQIFDEIMKAKIGTCLEGINLTVCAYGQTASGKTFTVRGNENHPGLIPLCVKEIFSQLETKKAMQSYVIKLSYIELYNEVINDLLNQNGKNLEIREDLKKGIHIADVREVNVKTEEDALNLLYEGDKLRKVAETKMNDESSRSHTIFRFYIEYACTSTKKFTMEKRKYALLNIVDLAGSEAVSKTKAEGKRFKEGTKINQSLLALSNVISALSKNGANAYVNFRDSKLTRLLQSSLVGNFMTIIICTISQSEPNYHETMNTLLFGTKAKKIKVKAIANEIADDPSLKLVEALSEIERLKSEINIKDKQIEIQTSSHSLNMEQKMKQLEQDILVKEEAIRTLEKYKLEKDKTMRDIQNNLFETMKTVREHISLIDENKKCKTQLEDANTKILTLSKDIYDFNNNCKCKDRKLSSKEIQMSPDINLLTEPMPFLDAESSVEVKKLSLAVEHKELEIETYRIKEVLLNEKCEEYEKLLSEFSQYKVAVNEMINYVNSKGIILDGKDLERYLPSDVHKMERTEKENYDKIFQQKDERIAIQLNIIRGLEDKVKELITNSGLLQAENESITTLNNNLLHLKKEMENKISALTNENSDCKNIIKEREKRIRMIEIDIKNYQKMQESNAMCNDQKSINLVPISNELAKKLDEIIKENSQITNENIVLKDQVNKLNDELTNSMNDFNSLHSLYLETKLRPEKSKKRKSMAEIEGNKRIKIDYSHKASII